MDFEEEAIKVIERIAYQRELDVRTESGDDDDPAIDIIADALEDAYEKGYAKATEPQW